MYRTRVAIKALAGAALALAAAVVLAGAPATADAGETLPEGLYAKIQTNRGEITVRLFYKRAPLTVGNFVGLATGVLGPKPGTPFYDGLTFHRVEKGFVIQGGDPQGNGTGDPGYRFPDEIHPDLRHADAGFLSMANSGPNTNGSQFFITLGATPHLDGRHAVFGQVVQGLDVLDKIQKGDRMDAVTIERVGEEAEAFQVTKASFKAMADEVMKRQVVEDLTRRATWMLALRDKMKDATITEDDLLYVVEKEGEGLPPKRGAQVRMHYSGYLTGGQKFDSSLGGTPLAFPVGTGRMIPGVDRMIGEMKPGEKRTVIIPPNLGYGPRGIPGGPIPPNATLIFELELLQ